MKRPCLTTDPALWYKLAYVNRETHRLREEIQDLDVAAPVRERFLAAIAAVEQRAAALRRTAGAAGH